MEQVAQLPIIGSPPVTVASTSGPGTYTLTPAQSFRVNDTHWSAHRSQAPPVRERPEKALQHTAIRSAVELESKLIDLSEYLPLGCLHAAYQPQVDSQHPSDEWVEVNSCPHDALNLLGRIIADALASLLSSRWIRVFSNSGTASLRVHVLPFDVGRALVPRSSETLRWHLRQVLLQLDVSKDAWSGGTVSLQKENMFHEGSDENEHRSLDDMFDRLPSPSPDPVKIQEWWSRVAAEEILDEGLPALQTVLFPYQARSAAAMLQRETCSDLQHDPRVDERVAQNGRKFFYNPDDKSIRKEPALYSSNKGGILAESMGRGKTVICLALILSTKGHVPKVPDEYISSTPARQKVASLLEMCVTKINIAGLPARAYFDRLNEDHGIDGRFYERFFADNPPFYLMPSDSQPKSALSRSRRGDTASSAVKVQLCSATLIVAPRNLIHQWQSEIKKHIHEDALQLLVVADSKDKIPPAEELARYDVVMFSRERFAGEAKHGSDASGRRISTGAMRLKCDCPYIGASRRRNCLCVKDDEIYVSPLRKLHWLRIIIDEGHFFSMESDAVRVANSLVKAERRWIVSGTPLKDRSIGYSAHLASSTQQSTEQASNKDNQRLASIEEEKAAIKAIGNLAKHLQVHPWCDIGGMRAWEKSVYCVDAYGATRRVLSKTLARTVERLFIKTRREDFERDVQLPPLQHDVIRLQPSFYDKLSANLFVQVLRANAVTSERKDADYLFHKKNAAEMHRLVANLRQSNFAWTGWCVEDIEKSIKICTEYLNKADVKCSAEDDWQLRESMKEAQKALSSEAWRAMGQSHEVGLFVENWPDGSGKACSMVWSPQISLVGLTMAGRAQSFLNNRLDCADPTEGLREEGERFNEDLLNSQSKSSLAGKTPEKKATLLRDKGVPSSCLGDGSPTPRVTAKARDSMDAAKRSLMGKRKVRKEVDDIIISDDHPIARTSILGTTSAKLSYLLNRIVELQDSEKILVFYDGENAAYYLAQCLELLHIKHLIYAGSSLSPTLRSQYVVQFDLDQSIRVLLMDIRQGGQGLNINACSRVFFMNPVNRPGDELQAIGRAHRIGQTRPVFIETLLLEGTIEEAIFRKAKNMTRGEHDRAKQHLENNDEIRHIIQTAQIIPTEDKDDRWTSKMAGLKAPLRLFARPQRGHVYIDGIDVEEELDTAKSKKRAKKTQ